MIDEATELYGSMYPLIVILQTEVVLSKHQVNQLNSVSDSAQSVPENFPNENA